MAQKIHPAEEKAKKPLLMLEKVIRHATNAKAKDGIREFFKAVLKLADPQKPTQLAILAECLVMAKILLVKNQQYGNSALDPVRIFSKASPEEGMNIRLDDKLSRIKRGIGENEDPELDIIGYLILKRIGKAKCRRK